jgi:hypothetical protein
MSIVLIGSTSGSCTLQEQAVAGTTVLTLPTTSGTILTTGSSGQSIPSAALPTGSVLQVVQATGTAQISIVGGPTTTGFSASITPTASTSKILVIFNGRLFTSTNGEIKLFVYRGASSVQNMSTIYSNAGSVAGTGAMVVYDSPATTSSTTYTMYMQNSNATGYINVNGSSDGTYTLTLMEVAA